MGNLERDSIWHIKENKSHKGFESEQRVLEALRGIGFAAIICEHNGFDDQQKRDIKVSIKNNGHPAEVIYIQVKSSRKGVTSFYREIETISGGAENIEVWLKKKRIIVINGQEDPKEICKCFLENLKRLVN